MTGRREFIKAGAALSLLSGLREAEGAPSSAAGADRRGPARSRPVRHRAGRGLVHDRDHDARRPAPVRNFGPGLVGYTWEENGPALAVRAGRATLEAARWRRSRACPSWTCSTSAATGATCRAAPGRLDLAPGLGATSRRRAPPRTARRLPRPALEPRDPARPAGPARLPPDRRCRSSRSAAPWRKAGPEARRSRATTIPEFQRAFRELNELLAARARTRDPLVEFADLMMYGFWGEGHTSDWREPVPRPRRRRAHVPRHDASARSATWQPRAAGREHAARHQPAPATAAVLERAIARRLLAALGQRHPRRARSRSRQLSRTGRRGWRW